MSGVLNRKTSLCSPLDSLRALRTPQTKESIKVIPAQVPVSHGVSGCAQKDSQIEDKVVVPLLGDAVMEPDCGQGQKQLVTQEFPAVHPRYSCQTPGATISTLSPGAQILIKANKGKGFTTPEPPALLKETRCKD